MKKKILITLALAFTFCISVFPVQANTVSLSPVSQNVLLGGTVLVDVVLDFAASGASLDITYNNSVLDYTGVVFPPPVNPLFGNLGVAPIETSGSGAIPDLTGLLNDLAYVDFAGVVAGSSIAQLSFTAIGTGSTFLGAGYSNNPLFGDLPADVYEGATVNVNAVPIPATMLLFGSSIFGLVGLRRMKRS